MYKERYLFFSVSANNRFFYFDLTCIFLLECLFFENLFEITFLLRRNNIASYGNSNSNTINSIFIFIYLNLFLWSFLNISGNLIDWLVCMMKALAALRSRLVDMPPQRVLRRRHHWCSYCPFMAYMTLAWSSNWLSMT